jgi:hypothetical protein
MTRNNGHATLDGLLDALADHSSHRTAPDRFAASLKTAMAAAVAAAVDEHLGISAAADGGAIAELNYKVDGIRETVERLRKELIESRPASEPEPLAVDRQTAAKWLSLSPSMLDALRREGKLSAIVVGAKPLYAVADLRAFVEKNREGR